MGVFVSKVVEEHNYRTEWVELDENELIEKYGSVEEFKEKFNNNEIEFEIVDYGLKCLDSGEKTKFIEHQTDNQQIDQICSDTIQMYNEKGSWWKTTKED